MSRFPELNPRQFERFLENFSLPGSLVFRNNKWIGRTRSGKPFVVHVKHGNTKKYPAPLMEAISKDLEVFLKEFQQWLLGKPS